MINSVLLPTSIVQGACLYYNLLKGHRNLEPNRSHLQGSVAIIGADQQLLGSENVSIRDENAMHCADITVSNLKLPSAKKRKHSLLHVGEEQVGLALNETVTVEGDALSCTNVTIGPVQVLGHHLRNRNSGRVVIRERKVTTEEDSVTQVYTTNGKTVHEHKNLALFDDGPTFLNNSGIEWKLSPTDEPRLVTLKSHGKFAVINTGYPLYTLHSFNDYRADSWLLTGRENSLRVQLRKPYSTGILHVAEVGDQSVILETLADPYLKVIPNQAENSAGNPLYTPTSGQATSPLALFYMTAEASTRDDSCCLVVRRDGSVYYREEPVTGLVNMSRSRGIQAAVELVETSGGITQNAINKSRHNAITKVKKSSILAPMDQIKDRYDAKVCRAAVLDSNGRIAFEPCYFATPTVLFDTADGYMLAGIKDSVLFPFRIPYYLPDKMYLFGWKDGALSAVEFPDLFEDLPYRGFDGDVLPTVRNGKLNFAPMFSYGTMVSDEGEDDLLQVPTGLRLGDFHFDFGWDRGLVEVLSLSSTLNVTGGRREISSTNDPFVTETPFTAEFLNDRTGQQSVIYDPIKGFDVGEAHQSVTPIFAGDCPTITVKRNGDAIDVELEANEWVDVPPMLDRIKEHEYGDLDVEDFRGAFMAVYWIVEWLRPSQNAVKDGLVLQLGIRDPYSTIDHKGYHTYVVPVKNGGSKHTYSTFWLLDKFEVTLPFLNMRWLTRSGNTDEVRNVRVSFSASIVLHDEEQDVA